VTETVFFAAVIHPGGQDAVMLSASESLAAAQGICSDHSLRTAGYPVLIAEWIDVAPNVVRARGYHITRWSTDSHVCQATPPESGEST
jgi:hypothetical protein